MFVSVMPEASSKTAKHRKRRRLLCWVLIDLAVAAIVFSLLLYKPSRYDPLGPPPADRQPGQVSPYLTQLSSELYNGAQRGKPFELVVTEREINEAITSSNWPIESEGIWFSAPAVLFVPESIILMGTAVIRGAEFVVTVNLQPKVDPNGLLSLRVAKVKIGAMNITPLAKMIAKQMYADRLATTRVDTRDVRAKIAASLLNEEPFEPVFLVEDRRVRLDDVTITRGELILRLVPA